MTNSVLLSGLIFRRLNIYKTLTKFCALQVLGQNIFLLCSLEVFTFSQLDGTLVGLI